MAIYDARIMSKQTIPNCSRFPIIWKRQRVWAPMAIFVPLRPQLSDGLSSNPMRLDTGINHESARCRASDPNRSTTHTALSRNTDVSSVCVSTGPKATLVARATWILVQGDPVNSIHPFGARRWMRRLSINLSCARGRGQSGRRVRLRQGMCMDVARGDVWCHTLRADEKAGEGGSK
ncbi:hypothetical protein PENSPDRAFT_186411 [Peniophora sp. CONT]|nr:hypothetical protein PENSPDRAFT_186411 [Peniophora sp. CONT]